MVQIPDAIRCLFSAEIKQRNGSFVLEVPSEEIEKGDITLGETYRVTIVPPFPTSGCDSDSIPKNRVTHKQPLLGAHQYEKGRREPSRSKRRAIKAMESPVSSAATS